MWNKIILKIKNIKNKKTIYFKLTNNILIQRKRHYLFIKLNKYYTNFCHFYFLKIFWKKKLYGLIKGYKKKLIMKGLGLKVLNYENRLLILKLGYSHNIYCKIPKNIKLTVYKDTVLNFESSDLDALQKICFIIKKFYKINVYKQKGIFFENEKAIKTKH